MEDREKCQIGFFCVMISDMVSDISSDMLPDMTSKMLPDMTSKMSG